MAERKVLVKYYPPDYDPRDLVKAKRASGGGGGSHGGGSGSGGHDGSSRQCGVRMMLPFSLKCFTCCNYLYVGTKFNMRMETCSENYLGIKKHRFYMKCTHCHSEITIKTDPKNHDYVCENGGSRTYEAWRDARAAEQALKAGRVKEEEGNAMKFLENRTHDSKREMDIMDALDEIRNITR